VTFWGIGNVGEDSPLVNDGFIVQSEGK